MEEFQAIEIKLWQHFWDSFCSSKCEKKLLHIDISELVSIFVVFACWAKIWTSIGETGTYLGLYILEIWICIDTSCTSNICYVLPILKYPVRSSFCLGTRHQHKSCIGNSSSLDRCVEILSWSIARITMRIYFYPRESSVSIWIGRYTRQSCIQ